MRAATAVLASLLLSVISSTPLGAQNAPTPASPPPGGTDSARCATLPPTGSYIDTVLASVAIDPPDALPSSWAALLLDGFVAYFHAPVPLGVPVRGGDIRPRGSTGPEIVSLAINGQVVATLRRTGALELPRVVTSTLSPKLDLQLLRAVQRIDSAAALPPFSPEVRADSVRVRFFVNERPDSGTAARPLFIAQQPTWVLERSVLARRGNPQPAYPRVAEEARVEGSVLLSFVVDTNGTARPETLRLLRSPYRDFVAAALEVLPRMRFDPARIDGCPVMQLVQMPFEFRFRRP